jgi:hypothetical protein
MIGGKVLFERSTPHRAPSMRGSATSSGLLILIARVFREATSASTAVAHGQG